MALTKGDIKKDLIKKDEELKKLFASLRDEFVENFTLDFFGVKMSFSEYTHILVQHECMHIGIWSTMAAFGEFELPQSWKNDWGF